MIASQFNLDQRLSELRPSEEDLRVARELRRAASPATRPARSAGDPARNWVSSAILGSHRSRLAAD